MLTAILYSFIALFLLIYFLRALLVAGFQNYQHKKSPKWDRLLKSMAINLLTLNPLFQKRLPAKVIDNKVYERFKVKAQRYYIILWVLLFMILLLVAQVYLDAF